MRENGEELGGCWNMQVLTPSEREKGRKEDWVEAFENAVQF